MKLNWLAEKLEWIEEKSKPLFVVMALLLYGYSLVQLMLEIDLGTDLSRFLVEALANLSIPFTVILLHGLLELIASISHSNLRSAQRQFEIVLLVVVRSFFVDFAEVNTVVGESLFAEPVQKAVVKVLAIVMMTALIIYFKRWSEDRTLDQYIDKGRRLNHYKQLAVVALVLIILFNMLEVNHFFNNITFISLIFTGLIVIDAVFLILSIFRTANSMPWPLKVG